MATASDIILYNDDLLFENGDFKIGDSDQQHIQDIVFENIGSYKEFPLLGVGIINYLNSSGLQLVLKRVIKSQLESDGYSVDEIIIQKDDISSITIDATRK